MIRKIHIWIRLVQIEVYFRFYRIIRKIGK